MGNVWLKLRICKNIVCGQKTRVLFTAEGDVPYSRGGAMLVQQASCRMRVPVGDNSEGLHITANPKGAIIVFILTPHEKVQLYQG